MTLIVYEVGMYRAEVEQDPIISQGKDPFSGVWRNGFSCYNTLLLNVTFTDCKFHGNRGTAIGAYQSTF